MSVLMLQRSGFLISGDTGRIWFLRFIRLGDCIGCYVVVVGFPLFSSIRFGDIIGLSFFADDWIGSWAISFVMGVSIVYLFG